MTYVAMSAWWLRHKVGDAEIDGVTDHPLLRMSPMNPSYVVYLEPLGY